MAEDRPCALDTPDGQLVTVVAWPGAICVVEDAGPSSDVEIRILCSRQNSRISSVTRARFVVMTNWTRLGSTRDPALCLLDDMPDQVEVEEWFAALELDADLGAGDRNTRSSERLAVSTVMS